MRFLAPAKINLTLNVVPNAGASSARHRLSSLFHLLDFGDEFEIVPSAEFQFVCTSDLGISFEENLAWRAAQAFARAAHMPLPSYTFTLYKGVPSGAGLGGGSSDAATMLMLLNKIAGMPLAEQELQILAAELGSDVPVFLAPTAASYMDGTGDHLKQSLVPLAGLPVVLAANTSEPVSTAQAYRSFDTNVVPACRAEEQKLVELLKDTEEPSAICEAAPITIEQLRPYVYNNMSAAVFKISPATQVVHEFLRDAPEARVMALSGSGGASFALCETADEAVSLARRVRGQGWWSQATRLSAQASSAQVAL